MLLGCLLLALPVQAPNAVECDAVLEELGSLSFV